MSESNKAKHKDRIAIFQDLKLSSNRFTKDDDSDEEDALSPAEAMFEIANASHVGYRIKKGVVVTVRQDLECQEHTGGIVWETSYLLATYLLEHYRNGTLGSTSSKKQVQKKRPLGRTLEVGAGCGLLGLILATSKLTSKMIVSEATEAMPNLRNNIIQNKRCLKKVPDIDAIQLRWDHLDADVLSSGDTLSNPFDCIVGTDIIFREDLVRPLLKALHFLSHSKTIIYICVQERCSEAHAAFLRKASKYFSLADRTENLRITSGCSWGVSDLESRLYILTDKVEGRGKRKRGTNDHQ